MKMKHSVILLVFIALSHVSTSQDLQELFGKRNEIYFSFQVKSAEDIHALTRIISIDNVKGDTVWAYANMKEFLRFSQMGYDITLLPHPGDGAGVEMIDHYDPMMPATVWNYYPTYSAYESLMTQFQANYPSICKVTTIATLSSGRKLLVVKISDNVATDETEPEFLYTSSMHGDETTGYVLMLHLIDYLLSNYGTNTEVSDLINNMEIYINPLANPDGTYAGGNNTVSGATRNNGSGIELNRNYPDIVAGPHPDGNPWAEETVAFMDFASQHHFVASANFHGGAEVFNYPWDTWATLAADDAWWYYVGREYADTVHTHSPATYMDDEDNGVTNGFAWYEANGTRQDYMNYWQHCREVTIELSNTKLLPAAQLETHWNYNWRSLILYMKEARYGIHGIITDQTTGNPVAAKVFLLGHDIDNSEVYSSANNGDVHRPLKAGVYDIEVSAPCYTTYYLMGQYIGDHTTWNFNVMLPPSAGVTTAAVTGITTTTATSGGEVICTGGSAITARGVCWGISVNPTIAGNHTTDGSGSGVFISNITGLSASTLYYVRAYVTTSNGTAYGSNLTFSTLCGTANLPLTENFNTTSFPACWTQQFSGTNAVNSWSVSTTTNAGGTANEMKSTWQNVNPGTTRLVTPPINTTAISILNLSFRHMLDAYGTGATLKVQSSSNGTTWTDEAWSVATTSSNISATVVNTPISNNLNSPTTYIAFTVTGNLYNYDYWYLDNISIAGPPTKTLNLKTYLEGLYVNGGIMRQAYDETGPHFGAGIADQVTIELHKSTSYSTILYTSGLVNLSTTGNITITGIPSTFNSSYYITVRHRNSIETTTFSPVSFAGNTINYDFSTAASQAYGSNQYNTGGVFMIFGSDVNQDGTVDTGDMNSIENESTLVTMGYVAEDVNGDGIVDTSDMNLVENNSNAFIQVITP
jgi:hypothetical protein